jgi:hypothetical protein
VDIQQSTDVVFYNLNTIGSSHMVKYDDQKIIPAMDNNNTFAKTIMMFATDGGNYGDDELLDAVAGSGVKVLEMIKTVLALFKLY